MELTIITRKYKKMLVRFRADNPNMIIPANVNDIKDNALFKTAQFEAYVQKEKELGQVKGLMKYRGK